MLQTAKVKRISRLGQKPSVDITVNNRQHCFMANGIATSNSHAFSYAVIGYWTAWVKQHFPLHFYTVWLSHAHNKQKPQEEIQELILDAQYFGIDILPPLVRYIDKKGFVLNGDKIFFSVSDIKGIGESAIAELVKYDFQNMTWEKFLYTVSRNISSDVVMSLIKSGALREIIPSRNKAIFEYTQYNNFTDREKVHIENLDGYSLKKRIEYIIDTLPRLNKNRKQKLLDIIETIDNPPYSLKDSASLIYSYENELLGVPITVSKIDTCNNIPDTHTCSDFASGIGDKFMIAVEILRSSEYTIKRGQNIGQKMGFVDCRDGTGSMKATLFSSVWNKKKFLLQKGNTVLLKGERSPKYPDSLTVYEVSQI